MSSNSVILLIIILFNANVIRNHNRKNRMNYSKLLENSNLNVTNQYRKIKLIILSLIRNKKWSHQHWK